MISASHPAEADAPRPATDARLYTIAWDGDSALALIFSGARHEGEAVRHEKPSFDEQVEA